MIKLSEEQSKKFWSRVDKSIGNGPNGDCWLWTGSTTSSGYGNLTLNKITYYAHRISLLLEKNIDPSFGEASHNCDNPPCVNPSHLTVSDHDFNMSEALKRRRMKHAYICGSFHHSTKLTDEIVKSIRDDRQRGVKQKNLANKWGVSVSTIKGIEHFRVWNNGSINEVRISTARE